MCVCVCVSVCVLSVCVSVCARRNEKGGTFVYF